MARGTCDRKAATTGAPPFVRHLQSALPLVALSIGTIAAAIALASGAPVRAEPIGKPIGNGGERTAFTDAEIADGLFKVAFGAELRFTAGVDRLRKFDGPIRVFIDNRTQTSRSADLAAVVRDIAGHVDHLDIAVTGNRKAANVVVTMVQDRKELLRTIRDFYGPRRARIIERQLVPDCLSGFGEDAAHRIGRSEVILTADRDDFSFFNCAYEELLQALGPINDDRSVPWTMFNDDVRMGFFDVYDQYILNIVYDPRVHPGMTRSQVGELLPVILPKIRSWVSHTNAIAPSGVQASNEHGAEADAPR